MTHLWAWVWLAWMVALLLFVLIRYLDWKIMKPVLQGMAVALAFMLVVVLTTDAVLAITDQHSTIWK